MNQKQESPFGNPRFLMALALTFFGLWGWQYYLSKKYPQKPTEQVAVATTASGTATVAPSEAQMNPAASGTVAAATTIPVVEEEKTFSYEDENVKFDVSSKGLGVKNYTLKKYTDRKGAHIQFESTEGQAELLANNNVVNFSVEKTGESQFIGIATVDGKKITRKLTFHKDTESFDSETEFDAGLDTLSLKLFQKHHKPESTSFLTPSFEQQDFIWIEAGSTKSESIAGLKENEGFLKTAPAATLASIGTQYFTAASINRADIVPSVSNKVENNMASVNISYNLKDAKITKVSQAIYLGPKVTNTLAKIDKQLTETLNYGMFGFISAILMKLMVFMFGVFGNWGLAIIALTLVVRAVLLPFNVMSFRSAQAMQKVKPKLDAIRERFKDDPMRMNKETMAVMKENNANPLSGCLPMLIQIPIFFALWRAIGSSIEIYQQPFFGWITDLSYHDPFFVFPILMGITMFLQQKMTPTTMDPTQAKILNFMPILFTLFMLTLPSGLTLYNFVSALFGVIQQYFLLKETKNNSPAVA
ncbi:MAG: membrane protein insertase YidC [Pseudobdellovibrio sp.]|nr:membrane protein insertase YidC [Pseudobdellovibrio sp.]